MLGEDLPPRFLLLPSVYRPRDGEDQGWGSVRDRTEIPGCAGKRGKGWRDEGSARVKGTGSGGDAKWGLGTEGL